MEEPMLSIRRLRVLAPPKKLNPLLLRPLPLRAPAALPDRTEGERELPGGSLPPSLSDMTVESWELHTCGMSSIRTRFGGFRDGVSVAERPAHEESLEGLTAFEIPEDPASRALGWNLDLDLEADLAVGRVAGPWRFTFIMVGATKMALAASWVTMLERDLRDLREGWERRDSRERWR